MDAPLIVGGPASTLALATDLARLMDDMVDPRRRLGRTRMAWYRKRWINIGSFRCEFLQDCETDDGPLIWRRSRKIEPAARRDLLIEAEAARLSETQDGPVIAAGSTGSMPATAKFLKVIAGLPQGTVVLPGLDTDLDDEAWQLIGGATDAHGKVSGGRIEPSAIRDACATRQIRPQAG